MASFSESLGWSRVSLCFKRQLHLDAFHKQRRTRDRSAAGLPRAVSRMFVTLPLPTMPAPLGSVGVNSCLFREERSTDKVNLSVSVWVLAGR